MPRLSSVGPRTTTSDARHGEDLAANELAIGILCAQHGCRAHAKTWMRRTGYASGELTGPCEPWCGVHRGALKRAATQAQRRVAERTERNQREAAQREARERAFSLGARLNIALAPLSGVTLHWTTNYAGAALSTPIEDVERLVAALEARAVGVTP